MPIKPEEVRESYKRITHNLNEAMTRFRSPQDKVALMAVTKTVPAELVNVAIDCGVRLLGENRVQEYLTKKDLYRKEAEVQFIGRVQTNKLRQLMPDVTVIQAVDSLHTAEAISHRAALLAISQSILIEVNIGGELSKGGVSPDALPTLLQEITALPGIAVRGLMAIPPPGEGARCFPQMQTLFLRLRETYPALTTLSMGMSGDYEEAVRYGSTMVRIGSGLFGAR